MTMHQIIVEVRADKQDSQGFTCLSQSFFLNLHHTEIKYIRLKHGRKTKQAQRQLLKTLEELVEYYTDCIDYFGATGDAAGAYFQIKIKQISKYYQFLANQVSQLASSPEVVAIPIYQAKYDLGSISDQTGAELLPQQERQKSVAGKQALNQNLMACLQSQDITSHIKANLKKTQKMHFTIIQSLKQQDDFLTIRKKNRINLKKSRAFLSFSENNMSGNISPQMSEMSELMMMDMDALEATTPQQLKQLAMRLEDLQNRQQTRSNSGAGTGSKEI